jgi:hypothetical protein
MRLATRAVIVVRFRKPAVSTMIGVLAPEFLDHFRDAFLRLGHHGYNAKLARRVMTVSESALRVSVD